MRRSSAAQALTIPVGARIAVRGGAAATLVATLIGCGQTPAVPSAPAPAPEVAASSPSVPPAPGPLDPLIPDAVAPAPAEPAAPAAAVFVAPRPLPDRLAAAGERCQTGEARSCTEVVLGLEHLPWAFAAPWADRACSLGDPHGCRAIARYELEIGLRLTESVFNGAVLPRLDVPARVARACQAGDWSMCLMEHWLAGGDTCGAPSAGIEENAAPLVAADEARAKAALTRALELARTACEGDDPWACGQLATLRSEGCLGPADRTAAMAFFMRGTRPLSSRCEGGDAQACSELSRYCRDSFFDPEPHLDPSDEEPNPERPPICELPFGTSKARCEQGDVARCLSGFYDARYAGDKNDNARVEATLLSHWEAPCKRALDGPPDALEACLELSNLVTNLDPTRTGLVDRFLAEGCRRGLGEACERLGCHGPTAGSDAPRAVCDAGCRAGDPKSCKAWRDGGPYDAIPSDPKPLLVACGRHERASCLLACAAIDVALHGPHEDAGAPRGPALERLAPFAIPELGLDDRFILHLCAELEATSPY